MDMELTDIISEYGLEEVQDSWIEAWKESLADFPENCCISYIQDEYLLEANNLLKLSDGLLMSLLETMQKIRENNSLCRIIWYCSKLIVSDTNCSEVFRFIRSERLKKDFNGLFGVIILLSGLKNVVKKHADIGIPQKITVDTFSDLQLWMDNYHKKYGEWGMEEHKWLFNHFTGKLYRLGRLQYIHTTFKGNIKVFKNKRDGKVLAFSEPEIRYRSDGQVDGSSDVFDPTGSWVSQFLKDEFHIKGNVISPYGYAEKKITEIAADEWEAVLSKGDPVLDIHIPEGGKMSFDLCGESLNQAMLFFSRYFPEKKFKAFVCGTWLFDSQLQEILPQDSNIIRFQREFYLYPVYGDGYQIYERVFGSKPKDLSTAPRDSSLRIAVLDFVMSGRHFHDAAGFILTENLNWAGESYQKIYSET